MLETGYKSFPGETQVLRGFTATRDLVTQTTLAEHQFTPLSLQTHL